MNAEQLFVKLNEYCQSNDIELTDNNFFEVCKKAWTAEEYQICFLSDEISDRIDNIAEKGDYLAEIENYEEAIKVYKSGIKLIPEPQNDWDVKIWFTSAIADAYWLMNNYLDALKYLDESLLATGGALNPFVRLRRGQVLFELSNMEEAKSELKIALELGGEELFEDENNKYMDLARL